MTPRLRRYGVVGATTAVLLLQNVLGGVIPVAAAEGQLTRIGGNATACPTDEQALAELRKPVEERTKAPTGISASGFTTDRGMQAIASDIYGGLYLLSAGQVMDRTSIIAGRADAIDANPVPGKDANLTSAKGIAVDPYGKSLWVAQPRVSGVIPTENRVRHVNLTTTTHEVTTVAETGGAPTAVAADARGNVYVTEGTGDVSRIDQGGGRTVLGQVSGPTGIAVDVTGTEVYVAGSGGVYRLSGSSKQLVAGGTITHADGTAPVTAPKALALGHETDGQIVGGRYLYIADGGRVVRVDLKASSPVITTVAGGGSQFVSSTPDARTAKLSALGVSLAADMAGHVYIADSNQCAVFQLETPAPFSLNTAVTNPPAVTITTLLNGGSRTGDADKPAGDPATNANGNPQGETGTAGQQGGQPRTEIVPGSETAGQQNPQTELRIVDQGNAVTAPQQGAQPSSQPVQTADPVGNTAPAANATPAANAPADAGTAVVTDPGATSTAGVAADSAPVVPLAPAAAPVPPAPASAPPPAAPQPVSNVGLAHGDSGAPARGATRYAMVRNDEEQSLAGALAMAGAGALVAIFLCVMFVAPGASSKPKPRPKGAY